MSITAEQIHADNRQGQSRENLGVGPMRLLEVWSLSTLLYHESTLKTIDVDSDYSVYFRVLPWLFTRVRH